MKTAFKLLLIPVVSIVVFIFDPKVALCLVVIQTVLSFVVKISPRQMLHDLRAVLYYAALLIFARFIGVAFSGGLSRAFFLELVPTLYMLLKLFCVMQTAAIVLRTSTSLEIREALEKTIRQPQVVQMLALFICFIPQVSKNWEQIKRAWIARGGKKSLRMLLVLLPILFSVGMKQAYNSARAICARK